MVLDSIKLKQINTDLVREAIRKRDFSVKNTIAAETGLSVATCSNILKELLEQGEIKEVERAASTGGRPSRQFTYNSDFAHIALVYLRVEGKKRFCFTAVSDMKGTLLSEKVWDFPDIGLPEVESIVTSLIRQFPKIRVLSIGVPGVVHDGIVDVCDIDSLSHFSLEQYLHETFNVQVVVENDVNTAAIGYYHRLADKDPESIVFLYYPEDGAPGAGIVVNGKLLRGRSKFAGEISFMPSWISREEQGAAQKDDIFHEFIGDAILSINCLINPEFVVLSGQWLSSEVIAALQKYIHTLSPKGHGVPVIIEQDIHQSYLDGLIFNGTKKMSCGLEVIEN